MGQDHYTAPVAAALCEAALQEGDRVMIRLEGVVRGIEPGQLHLQVERAGAARFEGGNGWEEFFVMGREPMATIRDWIG
jgi:hypothetical protein